MNNKSVPMKSVRTRFSARYLVALRAHLGQKGPVNGNNARDLGCASLASGLATLDLALMHEEAVIALASSYDFANSRNGSLKRASRFFIQALLPLEVAQRTTRETNQHLQRHAAALAKGNRRLQREITRRQAGETAIRQGKERYQKLFFESQVMQKKLRYMTRQIIMAQEEERKEISRELHDEVDGLGQGRLGGPAHAQGKNRPHPAAGGKIG